MIKGNRTVTIGDKLNGNLAKTKAIKRNMGSGLSYLAVTKTKGFSLPLPTEGKEVPTEVD